MKAQDLFCQWIFKIFLNSPVKRTSSKLHIVTFIGQERFCIFGQLELDGSLIDLGGAGQTRLIGGAGPSAFLTYAITGVLIILVMLMFTDMGGQLESLVTLGFLAFFFVYLLRILNVIDKPFKVGKERTDDDVSLFLLTEFVVHAHSAGEGGVAAEDVAVQAEALEQRLVEVEEAKAEELEEAAAEEAEQAEAAEEAAADMVEHFTAADEPAAGER